MIPLLAGTTTVTHKATLLSTATRSKRLDKKSSDNNNETKIKYKGYDCIPPHGTGSSRPKPKGKNTHTHINKLTFYYRLVKELNFAVLGFFVVCLSYTGKT